MRLPTLRSRLVMLALALTIPALLASAVILYVGYQRDRSEVAKHLQETTRALSIVVDRHFGQAEALLWGLATSPELETGDYATFDARARAATRHLGDTWVVVEEPGRQVVNTRLPAVSTLPTGIGQTHWEGLQPGQFRTSNLFTGIVAQGPTVAVDTLVARPDGVHVYASILMPADAVARILVEQRLPPTWTGAIIDRTGLVVARSREPERFVGGWATPDTRQRVLEGVTQGIFESVSLEGTPTVLALSRSPASNWTTVVAVPQAELSASAVFSAVNLAAAGALLITLGLVAASVVGRAITQPVQALVTQAQAIARGDAAGDRNQPEQFSQFHETAAVRDALVHSAQVLSQRQAERDRAEGELRRLNESLEERVGARTSELAAANAKLTAEMEERRLAERQLARAQRLESVGQLTGGIAHDFNNLLTAVLGSLEMLGRRAGDALDERSRRLLDNAVSAAERGAKLTAQLLAFSRRQRLEPRATNVNLSIEGVTGLLQSTLGGTIRIETHLRPDVWPALADATQLELIVLNLALNARDAMPLGGALRLETMNITTGEPATPEEPPPGEHVVVSVADTGMGIPADVLTRVFEPFFTTKEVGKGSGLGLSQVLGIAKQLGGGVRISSRHGEGTTVEVYLPRAQLAENESTAVGNRETNEAMSPEVLVGRRVLLVDDDADVRRVVAGMLREAGAVVKEAASGSEAVEVIEAAPTTWRPDLVLLDYAMPGMTGTEAARRLRGLAPELPLVMMTGFADLQAAPLRGEVDVIIGKPFKSEELLRTLVSAIGEPQRPVSDKVTPLKQLP